MTYRARNLFAAIGLAVLAALFVGFYITNYKKSVEHSQQNVTVFVAARDIPQGMTGADVAAKGYLKQEQVLRQSVVPGAISSSKQIDTLVAAQPTYSGEQISLNRFSTAAVQGIRGVLRGTLRAVQVAGDGQQTLAGTLQVGDHVDVVANVKVGPVDAQVVVSRIVLRNIRVLKAAATESGANLSTPSGSGSPVVLAVTDTQVQKLFYVVKNDDWTLELRPIVKAADSPETVETQNTIATDGLRGKQLQIALGGLRP